MYTLKSIFNSLEISCNPRPSTASANRLFSTFIPELIFDFAPLQVIGQQKLSGGVLSIFEFR